MFNYQTKTTRMKKNVLMLGLAAIAFTACTNEEVTHFAENRAIGFDTFVGKHTKADVTSASLKKFYVYGVYSETSNSYASGTTTVFNNMAVTKNEGTWKNEDARYWVADKYYKFAAYADGDNGNALTTSFNEAKLVITDYEAGTNDLIFATPNEVTANTQISANNPINLTFNHLLSKVKFTFTSGFPKNYKMTISDLKISVPNKATYTEGTGWDTASDNAEKTFTISAINDDYKGTTLSQSSNEHYVIPQGNSTLKATFKVTVTDGGGYNKEATLEASLKSGDLSSGNAGKDTWVNGYAYNYKATIKTTDVDSDLKEITFSVDAENGVNAWQDATSEGISTTPSTTTAAASTTSRN